MAINRDKPHLWKADIARSVDYYNDWFMNFAPEAYRSQRERQTDLVEEVVSQTENLRRISPDLLRQHPLALQWCSIVKKTDDRKKDASPLEGLASLG